jgi:CheY-like chemotaxis protein
VAARAEANGRQVSDFVSLVLTDVEMPEMDGFMLTRQIKADRRFAGIPVIMHSSLSGSRTSSSASRSAWTNTCRSSSRSACRRCWPACSAWATPASAGH